MASADIETSKPTDPAAQQTENGVTEKLANDLAKVELRDQEPSSSLGEEKHEPQPQRPLHVYSRSDVLLLSKSPLVKQPDGMPSLKDWFGCVTPATLPLTPLMRPIYI